MVPYGIAIGVIGLAYLPFVFELPKETRNHFLLAGVIFVTGAFGIEMLDAREADLYGYETVRYCVLYSLEEMLGIVLFIYALLRYLAREQGGVVVVLELAGSSAGEAGADGKPDERQNPERDLP